MHWLCVGFFLETFNEILMMTQKKMSVVIWVDLAKNWKWEKKKWQSIQSVHKISGLVLQDEMSMVHKYLWL